MTTPHTVDFDININNYTIEELEGIVGLGDEYTAADIKDKVRKYIESSKNNLQMVRFFRQAENRLFTNIIHPEEDDAGGADDDDDDDDAEGGRSNRSILVDEHTADGFGATTTDLINNVVIATPPTHPQTQNTITDSVAPGSMNPFQRKTVKRVICIDSLFRKNPDSASSSSSSFTVFLPMDMGKVVSMGLVSLDLPTTWYTVNDASLRNRFIIHTYNVKNNTDTEHIIDVPPGNYTRDLLTATINNLFSNVTSGINYLVFEINPISSKSIIRAKMNTDVGPAYYPFDPDNIAHSPEFRFTLSFPTVTTSSNVVLCDPESGTAQTLPTDGIGWMLGFRDTTYTVTKEDTHIDNVSYMGMSAIRSAYLESEGVYRDNVDDYIFLDVDEYNNNFVSNSIISLTQNDYLGKTILARIPIVKNASNMVHNNGDDNTFKRRDYFGPVRIDKLHIRLLDKWGALVNLRGHNFSFALELIVQYS